MNSLLRRVNEALHDMCYIWEKEIRTVFQDEGVFLFCIVVPLLYPLLYSWIYNNEVVREVPVAVVDQSNSQLSRQFVRMFDASPDTKVAYRCNDLHQARDLVEKQVVHGILYFPADFENRLLSMQQAHVSVYCDMSLMLTYKAIYTTATAVSQNVNAGLQVQLSGNQTSREDEILVKPLDFEEVQLFNPTGGYGSFIIPGVLVLILQQTLLLGIGLSAGTARENNRFKELIPISHHYNGVFRIVGGKTLCYAMIYAVMAAYICLVVPRIFSFTSLLNARELFGIMVPYVLACIFFGMFVSGVVRYRENVILLVVFTSVPLLFLAGLSWPQSAIPHVWQMVGYVFPSTFGIRAFDRMMVMGATLGDVEREYHTLWMQVVFYFFATCLVYHYQLYLTRRHVAKRISTVKQSVAKALARKAGKAAGNEA